MKRGKRGGSCLAILLVLAGIALLGFNLGWFPYEYKAIIISWQMLLIGMGLISLAKRQIFGSFIFISIGVFFIIPVIGANFPDFMGGLPTNMAIYWPVLLIIAGIFIILGILFGRRMKAQRCNKWRRECNSETVSHNETDFIKKDMMFNGSEHIVFSDNFQGGDINVGFGELKLDLRRVTNISTSNLLEINGMFGSIIIYIPANCQINFVKDEALFAEVKDKRIHKSDEAGQMVLNLKCSVLFGSIEIRD